MKLSVIICTHNPRPDHLARTAAGLGLQTLATHAWELIVIDNASVPPVDAATFRASHPSIRVVREPTLGLVAARLRGIREATGDLLVFVDDDNVLAPNYLQLATEIAGRVPKLGAFGGQVHGEFETPPPSWFRHRLDRLAITEFSVASQTGQTDGSLAPCGAGLCVKAEVATAYRSQAESDPRRQLLGRSGRNLGSGDDTDLALTACDMGYEMGRFPELHLVHLIPSGRLSARYLARVTRGHAQAQLRLLTLRKKGDGHARKMWHARFALWKWTVADVLFSLFPKRSQPQ